MYWQILRIISILAFCIGVIGALGSILITFISIPIAILFFYISKLFENQEQIKDKLNDIIKLLCIEQEEQQNQYQYYQNYNNQYNKM